MAGHRGLAPLRDACYANPYLRRRPRSTLRRHSGTLAQSNVTALQLNDQVSARFVPRRDRKDGRDSVAVVASSKRKANGPDASAPERCLRAIAWNSWSEQTGLECGWTKTHLIETDRGQSPVGRKTLCGTTVPEHAERLDGTDIRTNPCTRCLRGAGKKVVGRRELARSAVEAYEGLERW